jgi:arginine deiminase
MHPSVAFTLTAHTVTLRSAEMGPDGMAPDGMGEPALRVSRPRPFLEAAAEAIGIDRLNVIDTGLEPVPGRRGQWDDSGNALAVGPRLTVVHERNTETISRLEAAGIQVVQVPGSELSSARGGPRCMSCAVGRDAAMTPAQDTAQSPAQPAGQQSGTQLSAGSAGRSGPVSEPPSRLPQPELAPA